MNSVLTKKVLICLLLIGLFANGASQAEAGRRRARNSSYRRYSPVKTYQHTTKSGLPPGAHRIGNHVVLPLDVKPTEYHENEKAR